VREDHFVYFWRTARGHEVDLLIDSGKQRVPVEIKLRSAPTFEDARDVSTCLEDPGLPHGYVIYPGLERHPLDHHVTAIPAEQLLSQPEDVVKL
jgi:predicted AAA+ superfamily ATPase